MGQPKTLYEKIWDRHIVDRVSLDGPSVLYIDRHYIHEVTSPQAFDELRKRGLSVYRPDRTIGVIDHSIPTLPADKTGVRAFVSASARNQVETFLENCEAFGVACHGWDSAHQGIVHVAGPELGLTLPGSTVVCGDSHTSTHGAFGALAFGIGTSEVGHVLATQCLLQAQAKTLAININGMLASCVSAKDVILAVIQKIGMAGGTGSVIEYRGSTVRAMSMEARMTLCNMSIEAGARAGMVAPDETTFAYLAGRPFAPEGEDWEAARRDWERLVSDPDAVYDREVALDASRIAPMVTFGTNPSAALAVDAPVPIPTNQLDRDAAEYMQIETGKPLLGTRIDNVFIGSCTNSRLSDLEAAAAILRGQHVADHVRLLIVPGSRVVKRDAEALGLHKIFLEAGAEWREPGCSMCIAMNGDIAAPGSLTVSTSNRNFAGRQGPDSRTILAGPALAAASAIAGAIADPRKQGWIQ